MSYYYVLSNIIGWKEMIFVGEKHNLYVYIFYVINYVLCVKSV